MAKKQRPIFGVATRIFQKQNSSGGVPKNILASSRAVMAGNATQSDRDQIFGYYQRNLSSPSAISNKQIQRSTRTLGNLAGSVANGQFSGYGGNIIGATQSVLQNVNSTVRDKGVQKVVQGAVNYLGGDGAGAVQGLKSVGKLAGQASSVLGYFDKAAQIVSGVARFGETMAGIGEPDYVRQARANAVMARSDPRRNNPYGRDLADSEQKAAEIQAGARWLPDAVRDKVVNFQKQRAGVDPLAMQMKNLWLQNSQNRILNVAPDSVMQQASNRVYQDKYGMVEGALRQKMDAMLAANGIHDAEAEAAVIAKSSAMQSRAEALKSAGFQFIQQGNLDAGKEFLHQANSEVAGAATAWANPEGIYCAMLTGASARRQWAFSCMPRRTRTGE